MLDMPSFAEIRLESEKEKHNVEAIKSGDRPISQDNEGSARHQTRKRDQRHHEAIALRGERTMGF